MKKSKKIYAVLAAVLLFTTIPMKVFAGEAYASGLTNGEGARVATNAFLSTISLSGYATTGLTTPGISTNYYSLATSLTIHYVNQYGHNLPASDTGTGYAHLVLSGQYSTVAYSQHNVFSSAYGNWGASLTALP